MKIKESRSKQLPLGISFLDAPWLNIFWRYNKYLSYVVPDCNLKSAGSDPYSAGHSDFRMIGCFQTGGVFGNKAAAARPITTALIAN